MPRLVANDELDNDIISRNLNLLLYMTCDILVNVSSNVTKIKLTVRDL